MSTQSYQGDIRCIVLRHLLWLAKKKLACPSCLVCRSTYKRMKDHCRNEGGKGDEIHEGLISEDFPTFHDAYVKAIAWTGSKAQLGLSSRLSVCFDLETVIQFKLRAGGIPEFDLLLQAAGKSAMQYICPWDLATFSDMSSLRDHWQKDGNQAHRKFESPSVSLFKESYTSIMGREIEDLPLGLNRPGTPSPHKCFKIDFVLKEISTEKLVEWYDKNRDCITKSHGRR